MADAVGDRGLRRGSLLHHAGSRQRPPLFRREGLEPQGEGRARLGRLVGIEDHPRRHRAEHHHVAARHHPTAAVKDAVDERLQKRSGPLVASARDMDPRHLREQLRIAALEGQEAMFQALERGQQAFRGGILHPTRHEEQLEQVEHLRLRVRGQGGLESRHRGLFRSGLEAFPGEGEGDGIVLEIPHTLPTPEHGTKLRRTEGIARDASDQRTLEVAHIPKELLQPVLGRPRLEASRPRRCRQGLTAKEAVAPAHHAAEGAARGFLVAQV